ncbi:uncharacterized protein LOC119836575 [Zerene cesonia]|uniref:uncharacterized protein LOC119836575 n=1 Tax=Zerene cesonia TaxID=33412 RepID=UPI0018E59BCF|nr:uncharacterized protein LOC119836575 [Zerene cesonia]
MVKSARSVEIDLIDCGIDHEVEVATGDVDITQYPWLGVLYYSYYGESDDARAVTTVALIQAEFVIAAAADIGPMPKHDFRSNARVLLGENWNRIGRKVRNYVIHEEYENTYNTIALVQLRTPVRNINIKPLCPPPHIIRNPDFYVVKFKKDYQNLQKAVIPVSHVPANLCREFYLRANLYAKKLRPPHVSCAVSLEEDNVCVWDAGSTLVSRDVWGRWQLLGLGVRGPGCGAPSRYLDIMSYFPWIESTLNKFKRITISKMSKHKFILRGGSVAYQRFGNCDEEEKVNLVYREMISLRTDNDQFQFLTYNLSIYDDVEFTCLTLELVNASAVSEMRVKHLCTRYSKGPPCYAYKGSVFEISVYLMFSDTCRFEMFAWGFKKNMTLLDIQAWKWEEGTYYEDFTMLPVEYRGPTHLTEFGFEPLDMGMWVPEYELWTTTEFDNSTWSSTTKKPRIIADDATPPPQKPKKQEPRETTTTEAGPKTVPTTISPNMSYILFMTGKPNFDIAFTQKPKYVKDE